MELLDRAQEIAGMRPLPKNAEDILQDLQGEASGDERELIGQLFEAIIVARSIPKT